MVYHANVAKLPCGIYNDDTTSPGAANMLNPLSTAWWMVRTVREQEVILANIVYLSVPEDCPSVVRGLSNESASGAEEMEIVLNTEPIHLYSPSHSHVGQNLSCKVGWILSWWTKKVFHYYYRYCQNIRPSSLEYNVPFNKPHLSIVQSVSTKFAIWACHLCLNWTASSSGHF